MAEPPRPPTVPAVPAMPVAAIAPQPAPLDPLTLPLSGSRLIEASAGTGKTWTIAALFLRLVLGHGRPAPLVPGQILVMTFTRAATRELSDRIRQRLVDAAAAFRSPGPAAGYPAEAVQGPDSGAAAAAAAAGEAHDHALAPPPLDPVLAGLLADHPQGQAREAAAWRLAAAAEAMDDAAVLTIDAWCQRMLREHAFDSGCLFDEELQADESALVAEAARDYWRREVLPLDGPALAAVLAQWPDADALAQDIGLWVQRLPPAPTLAAAVPPLQAVWAAAEADHAQAIAALKSGWAERADALRGWIDAQLDRRDSPFDGRRLQRRNCHAWLDALRTWATTPAEATPGWTDAARHRLSADGLAEALHAGAALPALPEALPALASLWAALGALAPAAHALRPHAAAHMAARIAEAKAHNQRFGFSDLQARLHEALDPQRHGARAERLRARIVAQFPVALVDEFQDTSPTQLAIFDRLYRLRDTPPELALLLIGDPKQAIYAFRGADIHAYLQARRATAGRHHMLGTNHRATDAMVAAVNTVFGRAEQRPGDSAFLYPPANLLTGGDAGGTAAGPLPPPDAAQVGAPASEPVPDNDEAAAALPFVPVVARGRPEQLVQAARPAPALQLALWPTPTPTTQGRPLLAALAAEQVVRWLDDPDTGFVPWPPPTGTAGAAATGLRRVAPADIAVLVRSASQAQAMQQALQARGVPSVYLSDKDSVFAAAEAQDLLRLLQAIAAPRDLPLARTAFATGLLGLPLAELLRLAGDETAFDALAAQLPHWQALWQRQGVLAALRHVLHALDLPARWLAQPGGERRLTNVLHLAELLQEASSRLDGEQALLRHLATRVAEAERQPGGGDEPLLRLESDADRVQIVTLHKSKGLEYPLVLLPFATLAPTAPSSQARAPLRRPGPQGESVLVWHPGPEDRRAAAQESLRESVRLLYVGLTRARHAAWVAVLPPKSRGDGLLWHASALGRVVSGPQPLASAEAIRADLQALVAAADLPARSASNATGAAAATAAPPIALSPAIADEDGRVPCTRLRRRESARPLGPAARANGLFDRQWGVASYSQLVKSLSDAPPAGAGDDSAPPLRWRDDEPAAATVALRLPAPWHRFPRGALPGQFLHGELEWLAGEGFALAEQPALQQALQRRCERAGWGHRADDVSAWLLRVCSTPLPPLGLPLSGLSVLRPEMEFWLPSDGLSASALDAACRRHILPGQPRPALPERALRGLLMGFADLVFSHGGRHGVIDYKSNALGPGDADYSLAAMQAAVLAHRYDVQAALYLLALYRLLQHRSGWRAAEAAGAEGPPLAATLHGAVFLFLRGIAGAPAGACPVAVPAELLDTLDALLPRPGLGHTGAAEAA